ncbi:MAG: GntP family permease [Vicinamibacterales bacterium]
MPPLVILALGVATVLGLIVVLRLNAFLALLAAALLVSLLAPGPWPEKASRVALAFGATAGSIGIVIALAAVVAAGMLQSRAADTIVRACLTAFGASRADAALMAAGLVLSIPVFFDTVFYLLVPLARSAYAATGRDYARYVMAIVGGAIVTHSLVPPTPGPLANAANLGVDLGLMVIMGLIVSIPAGLATFFAIRVLGRRLHVVPPEDHAAATGDGPPGTRDAHDTREAPPGGPSLAASLLPIVLPVCLIGSNTLAQALRPGSTLAAVTSVTGNPGVAMLAAAGCALALYVRVCRPDRQALSHQVEQSLMGGALIVLITSAGGAFGAMLQAAGIGDAIAGLATAGGATGVGLLLAGFTVASLLKFAQGSSTVAMITTSAMFAPLAVPGALACHPVYLALAIGSGSMVGSWMNDSGFWVVSRMGGLTEFQTLHAWSLVAAIAGGAGLVATLALARLVPLV